MQNTRRHVRYSVDVLDIKGKMSLTDKVEIIDISLGGVALKADRKLNPGKEYLLKLQEKGRIIDVTGVVVRSELVGMEQKKNGELVPMYTAGMMFKEGSMDRVSAFLSSIKRDMRHETPADMERRLSIRFQITVPPAEVMLYPFNFKVRLISLGGMLIHADHALEVETRVPMSLSLNAERTVDFIGRVASCKRVEEAGQVRHDIGVEFTDLNDRDKQILKEFIEYVSTRDLPVDPKKKAQ